MRHSSQAQNANKQIQTHAHKFNYSEENENDLGLTLNYIQSESKRKDTFSPSMLMISICKNELILCSRYFLSLVVLSGYIAIALYLSMSFLFRFCFGHIHTDTLPIRIILPKNSKSKCSIFPYIRPLLLYVFLALRSFFSSAFRTNTHTHSIRFVILLRHFRTFSQLV